MQVMLIMVLMLLQVADGASTYAVLRAGGRELNPLVRAVMRRAGPAAGLLLSKGACVALLAAWGARLPVWLLAVLVLAYVALTINNVVQWRALRGSRA